MFYTPNPAVVSALRDANDYRSEATALLDGIEMQWRTPNRESDYPRLQSLHETMRQFADWDGATEVVPGPEISELESIIATIKAWGDPALRPVDTLLKQALRVLTECAKTHGVSDTGLRSSEGKQPNG